MWVGFHNLQGSWFCFSPRIFHSHANDRKQPLRVHSMVKYAAIARGDAEIFLKFSQSGYNGRYGIMLMGLSIIVEEACGVETNAGPRPLDFSRGLYIGLDLGFSCLLWEHLA
ncbi:hypothetical protein Peur_037663 [Populus x canadensis]